MQLDQSWKPPRDPATGALLAEGKLWDFTEKISKSRREGKNRRDGATVSGRVLRLADQLGMNIFEEAKVASEKVPSNLSVEEKATLKKVVEESGRRRRMDGKANL